MGPSLLNGIRCDGLFLTQVKKNCSEYTTECASVDLAEGRRKLLRVAEQQSRVLQQIAVLADQQHKIHRNEVSFAIAGEKQKALLAVNQGLSYLLQKQWLIDPSELKSALSLQPNRRALGPMLASPKVDLTMGERLKKLTTDTTYLMHTLNEKLRQKRESAVKELRAVDSAAVCLEGRKGCQWSHFEEMIERAPDPFVPSAKNSIPDTLFSGRNIDHDLIFLPQCRQFQRQKRDAYNLGVNYLIIGAVLEFGASTESGGMMYAAC